MKKIHRIIQEEIFRLTESMDVYIGDANELQAETINDVAWILGLDVLEKEWWNKQSTERKEQYRNDKPMSVFTPDGGTEDVINFYVRGLSPEEVSQIVESVKRVLPLYEVKLLNIDDSEATRVIRFKVQLPQTNAAPRLNISNEDRKSVV